MNNLDKYYTKPEIAEKCIQFLSGYFPLKNCVEPSAGNGVFLKFLLQNTIAYDISPDNTTIIQQDFLTLTSLPTDSIIVGEPTFWETQCACH